MRLGQTCVPDTEKLYPLGSSRGPNTASTLITRSFVSYSGFQTNYYPGGTCLVDLVIGCSKDTTARAEFNPANPSL